MTLSDWPAIAVALLALVASAISVRAARRDRLRYKRHALQAAARSARTRRFLEEAYAYDIDEDLRTDLRRLLGAPTGAPAYACPRCPRRHHPGRPCTDTCDASAPGSYGTLVGPCVLRRSHDGLVHQDADGCRWTAVRVTPAGDTPIPYHLTDHPEQHP